MSGTPSTIYGFTTLDGGDDNDSVGAINGLIGELESKVLPPRKLTQAQIDALTGPQKPAGLIVYNTTTNRLQKSTGSTWVNLTEGTVQAGLTGTNAQFRATVNVTFPTAFASAPTVVATPMETPPSGTIIYLSTVTASGFTVHDVPNLVNVAWIAFGA